MRQFVLWALLVAVMAMGGGRLAYALGAAGPWQDQVKTLQGGVQQNEASGDLNIDSHAPTEVFSPGPGDTEVLPLPPFFHLRTLRGGNPLHESTCMEELRGFLETGITYGYIQALVSRHHIARPPPGSRLKGIIWAGTGYLGLAGPQNFVCLRFASCTEDNLWHACIGYRPGPPQNQGGPPGPTPEPGPTPQPQPQPPGPAPEPRPTPQPPPPCSGPLIRNAQQLAQLIFSNYQTEPIFIAHLCSPPSPPDTYLVALSGRQSGKTGQAVGVEAIIESALRQEDGYSRAVQQSLVKLGVPPGANIIVAGHSLGGMVAQNLPLLTQEWPFRRVITFGSPIMNQLRLPAATTRRFAVRGDLVVIEAPYWAARLGAKTLFYPADISGFSGLPIWVDGGRGFLNPIELHDAYPHSVDLLSYDALGDFRGSGILELDSARMARFPAALNQQPARAPPCIAPSGFVTVYHASINHSTEILAHGLTPSGGPTWVTTDLAAAEDAISRNRYEISQGLARDPGIIVSMIPTTLFDQTLGPSEREYHGFKGNLNSSEIILRTPEQFQLFNEFIVRGKCP